MDRQQLINAIRALRDIAGVRLRDIEEALKMPKNILSGMLTGTRSFPAKWEKLLIGYVEARAKGQKEIVIPIGEPRAKPGVRVVKPESKPVEPTKAKAAAAQKSPPPGMNKAQTIRWHRENSQTLQ